MIKSSLGFDPREIPWTLQEGHWPALPQHLLVADRLKWVFQNPPEWTPELKRENTENEPDGKQAATEKRRH